MRAGIQTKQLQALKDAYREAGKPWPPTASAVAEWALTEAGFEISQGDLIKILARQMAAAWEKEHVVDPQNRSVRRNHAVHARALDGQRSWVWDTIDTAERPFMETAFQQRRRAIVGDCRQLKTDVDSYNENYNPGEPIPLVLNFVDDVTEGEASEQPVAIAVDFADDAAEVEAL